MILYKLKISLEIENKYGEALQASSKEPRTKNSVPMTLKFCAKPWKMHKKGVWF